MCFNGGMATTTTPAQSAAEMAREAKARGFRIDVRKTGHGSEYIVTVETSFEPNNTAACTRAESDANYLLGFAPMMYPGSVWGTDSASVGGHAGLTGGYMRLNKSGVGGRFGQALTKALR